MKPFVKKLFVLILGMLFIYSSAACGIKEVPLPLVPSSSASVSLSPEPSEPEPSQTEPEEEPGFKSPTTGLTYPVEVPYHPIGVMIENSSYARPQTGLLQADIIYEALSESTITRFFCLFNDHLPVEVGPVRSARLYYIYIQKEWDSIFVHYGGPNESDKPSYVYGSSSSHIQVRVDGIKGKYDAYFWRSSDRSSPHNAYSDLTKIDAELYDYEAENRHAWKFADELPYEGEAFTSVELPYLTKKSTNVEFRYNKEDGRLYRYENGVPFMTYSVTLDENGNKQTVETQFSAQNLIVQYANTYEFSNDGGGRRMVEVWGRGTAEYFIGGVHRSGHWERETLEDITVYYLEDGTELTLLPGNTFISLHPDSQLINIYNEDVALPQ